MTRPRRSGVFLHPTSLPSRWGVGDLGPWASRFLDLLQESRQSIWQVLPLTQVAAHGSPYSAQSLFAGNTLLLSPERLAEGGYIGDLPPPPEVGDEGAVDFRSAIGFKEALVREAFAHSHSRVSHEKEYLDFRDRNSYWLEDYASFRAVSRSRGSPWLRWPEGLRDADRTALGEETAKLKGEVDFTVFSQYLFETQWASLAEEAHGKGVTILGDVPFYVLHDSADVWAHRELFKVDRTGKALYVGGVPPDYFSETGQRWGNPVYDWARLEATGYEWWGKRVKRSLGLCPMLRLDHFRGYVAYWEIPATCGTAMEGSWVPLPPTFIPYVKSAFPGLPFLAEDLGVITEDVHSARESLGIPGMRVLLFAFDGSESNLHLPRNHEANSFVYTGTHDTNTARGWYEDEATPREKASLSRFLGHDVTAEGVAGDLTLAALESVAGGCVIPMQDVLGLGGQARMNDPATTAGNWRWRAKPGELSPGAFRELGEGTASCGRG